MSNTLLVSTFPVFLLTRLFEEPLILRFSMRMFPSSPSARSNWLTVISAPGSPLRCIPAVRVMFAAERS